jgi:hypothetical protein
MWCVAHQAARTREMLQDLAGLISVLFSSPLGAEFSSRLPCQPDASGTKRLGVDSGSRSGHARPVLRVHRRFVVLRRG